MKKFLSASLILMILASGIASAKSITTLDRICEKFGVSLDQENGQKLQMIRSAAKSQLDVLRSDYFDLRNDNTYDNPNFENYLAARKKYENAAIAYMGFEGSCLSLETVGLTSSTVSKLEKVLSELDEAFSN